MVNKSCDCIFNVDVVRYVDCLIDPDEMHLLDMELQDWSMIGGLKIRCSNEYGSHVVMCM